MRYMGGKFKLSKRINQIINTYRKDNQLYVEPFCGSCAVGRKQKGNRVFNDIDNDLFNFLNRLVNTNYLPPEEISKQDYYDIKNDKENINYGYISFFCSFGGKKWGGYANPTKNRDYIKEQYNDTVKLKKDLSGSTIINYSFLDLEYDNCIVYCDPPYENSQKYAHKFDHDTFWEKCKYLSRNNIVLVSERVCRTEHEILKRFDIKTTLMTTEYKLNPEFLFLIK